MGGDVSADPVNYWVGGGINLGLSIFKIRQAATEELPHWFTASLEQPPHCGAADDINVDEVLQDKR